VDRQYEYLSSGASHRHGFLSYSSGEYVDSVAKKGMTLPLKISPAFVPQWRDFAQAGIAECGIKNPESSGLDPLGLTFCFR
jgi:hypothetical protein